MRQKPDGFANPIYVTRPMLPPLGEFTSQLEDIWDSAWLTNEIGRAHLNSSHT